MHFHLHCGTSAITMRICTGYPSARGAICGTEPSCPGTIDNDQLTLRPMSKPGQDQQTYLANVQMTFACEQGIHILLLITAHY